MGKWSKHQGRIPEEPTERDEAFHKALEEYEGLKLDVLTAEYNKQEEKKKEQAGLLKATEVRLDCLEFLIRKKIDASGADNVGMNGYTWTPTVEPYAAVSNSAALVKYYVENGMLDMLSVHPSRVTSAIKEEIEAGTIAVEIEQRPDGVGGFTDVSVVKSSVLPGVNVFMKNKLGRRKQSTK